MRIEAQIPVKLVNGLNTREHHMTRHRRASAQRSSAFLVMQKARPQWALNVDLALGNDPPITITITRRGGRRMDDDGLTASAKHVRDGIADWLGIDDGDRRLTWIVKQDRAPRGKHWVDVVVLTDEG